jgi:hypothetical protein
LLKSSSANQRRLPFRELQYLSAIPAVAQTPPSESSKPANAKIERIRELLTMTIIEKQNVPHE